MALLWEIFTSFFRIGLFTFGGGYAMLPLIEKEVIDNKQWTDKQEILDIFALAQSVPGVIAVNTSIFLGNRLAGLPGAIAAAAGVISPSIMVIVSIAMFFWQVKDHVVILRVFNGIRACVAGLVAAAAFRIVRGSCRDWVAAIIAVVAFGINMFTEIHPIWIILSGGIAGWLVYYAFAQKEGKEDELA